jgi:hypothetical protein
VETNIMSDTEDRALVDDDGCPTEWGIAQVRVFHGSPSQLVDLLEQLWWTPTLMTVDEWLDAQCRTVVRVSLATGGWGNEQIIDTLDGSMFHLRFWESSHRGGLHVYEVPKGEWEVVSQLGAIVTEGAGD